MSKLKELLKNKLKKEDLKLVPNSFDVVGDIIILDLDKKLKKYQKLIAQTLLKVHKNIRVVVKKKGIHYGKYRLQRYKVIGGERRKETIHKENNVNIKLNIQTCYFSPRLGTERLRVASLVKAGEKILVMFSGVGPFPLAISKNSKVKEIYAIELNKKACKYAKENLKLNKISNIKLFCGDVRKVIPKLDKKFDRILMPLPKGAKTYLDLALKVIKTKGIIHLYMFLQEDEIKKVKLEGFKILRRVKCGQYSPRLYRVCLDIRAL